MITAMAVRASKQEIDGTCGECAHGTPDMQFKNLSLAGEPTLVSCPFHEWKKVVSERACEKFITNK